MVRCPQVIRTLWLHIVGLLQMLILMMLPGTFCKVGKRKEVERSRRISAADPWHVCQSLQGEFKEKYGTLQMSHKTEVRRNVFNKLLVKP